MVLTIYCLYTCKIYTSKKKLIFDFFPKRVYFYSEQNIKLNHYIEHSVLNRKSLQICLKKMSLMK